MSLKSFIEETKKENKGKSLKIELVRSSQYKPTWKVSVNEIETNKRLKIFTFGTSPLLQQNLDILIESGLPVTITDSFLVDNRKVIEFPHS